MTGEDNEDSGEKTERGLMARLLSILGIERNESPENWLVLTRRFPFIVVGVFMVSLLGFGWFTHYTSTPAFCNDCHFIEPFYESWKTSTHSDVGCFQCHTEPGTWNYVRRKIAGLSEVVKTVTGRQPPHPQAEVSDAACLREGCHEERLEDPNVKLKGKYKFNHAKHLENLRRGKKLRCTSCHSQIVQGEHITVTESVCFTCHFKGRTHFGIPDPIGDCLACHEKSVEPVETAFGDTFDHKPFLEQGVDCWRCHSDSVVGTATVAEQVCLDCHGDPERLAKYEDSKFMHKMHVTENKVECFQCHSEIRHGLAPEPPKHVQKASMSCGKCHEGDHFPQQDLFQGTGGKGVEDQPGTHYTRQVDCIACHQPPDREHGRSLAIAHIETHAAGKQACIDCHGSAAGGMLNMWEMGLQQSLEKTNEALQKADKALEGYSDQSSVEKAPRELLEKARYNYEFVKRAHGVHNPGYALNLLDRAQSWATEATEIASKNSSSQKEKAQSASGQGS